MAFMLDVASQHKIAKGCTDAGLGYAQAATAAYSQMGTQAFDFWFQAMDGISAGLDSTPARKASVPATPKSPDLPFGFSPTDWMPFPFFEPRRMEAVMTADPSYNPFGFFMALMGTVPLRGQPASWPYAQAMINAGVPREVAWPTAEANAAVIGAAEAATLGFQKVLVACQSGSGFVSSLPVRQAAGVTSMHTLQSMMHAGSWARMLS
jgi:hypothetical protein